VKLSEAPIHSILLSIYPIIYLYARNAVFVPFEDTYRILTLSIGLAIIFCLGFRLILKDWGKAGLECSLLAVLFYSYGHIANLVDGWISQAGVNIGPSNLPLLWLVIFLLFTFLILKAELLVQIGPVLNIASVALISFPLASLILTKAAFSGDTLAEQKHLSLLRGEGPAEASMPKLPDTALPDIYYIVFDGYTRSDVLDNYYDYDNSAFVEALEDRGFYVVSSSRSNYLNTNYSLNTALNLTYFHEFPTRLLNRAKYSLRTNYVSDFLQRQGYEIVVFDSGSKDTNDQYADLFISSRSTGVAEDPVVNAFERLLIRTTLWGALLGRTAKDPRIDIADDVIASTVSRELDARRALINHAFSHLSDYASKQKHYFLFAHIYSPHIPFLFGPGGEELQYHEDMNLYWYEVEPENYIEYYTYQIDHLNQAVLQLIDRILAESEKPVVIVLQSDHGDDKYLQWNEPTVQGVNVRSAILNAIYYSDGSYQALYPSITPVNTFRLIFNHWFGTQYPLLPDRVYYHEHPLSTPFYAKPEFIDSCFEFNLCLPAHDG
jgi:hypothetical protein